MNNMKKTIPTLVGGAMLLTNPSVYALENAINTENEKQEVENNDLVVENSNDSMIEIEGNITEDNTNNVEVSVDINNNEVSNNKVEVEIVEKVEDVETSILENNKEEVVVEEEMEYVEEYKNILAKEKVTSEQKVMKVKVSSMSVRKEIAKDSEVKGTLEKDTYVDVYEQNSKDGWTKINYKGEMAYVNTSDLVDITTEYKEASKDGVVVRSGAGDEYGEFGTLKKGARVKIYQVLNNGWSKVDYNSKIAFVKTDDLVKSYTSTATVSVEKVNVYKTASSSSQILGESKKGETLFIYEESNGYYKVRYADDFGYVNKAELKVTSNTEKPQTGDMMIFSYVGAMGVSSLGFVAVNRKNKK